MSDSYDLTLTQEQFVASIDRMIPVLDISSLKRINVRGTLQELPLHSTFLEPSIEIFGIQFNIRQGGEYLSIESTQWPSLTAHGKTMREAIENMLEILRNAISEYIFVPESELTEDANDFRKFLIQKLLV